MENNIDLIETSEQAIAMTRAIGGYSFFVAGAAGTGKSVFIDKLRRSLLNVAVVAPTGVAALNCGGFTIHSYFGISTRLGWYPPCLSPVVKDRLKKVSTLIIDEISMVRADLLDNVDASLRLAKENSEPFGGVQVIMLGDMAQLPPVVTNADNLWLRAHYKSPYWFDARVWRGAPPMTLKFTTVFRQKEEHFANMLKKVRNGDYHVIPEINKRVGARRKDVITLCARNFTADSINLDEMGRLMAPSRTYVADIDASHKIETVPAPRYLELKVGAQVMMTKNTNSYVNGTIARVLETSPNYIQVQFRDGREETVTRATWELPSYDVSESGEIRGTDVAGYTQYPMMPAFAITIHKSQGVSLDNVHIDLGAGAFASGQAYVALSRCRTLDGMTLARPITARDILTDKRLDKWLS